MMHAASSPNLVPVSVPSSGTAVAPAARKGLSAPNALALLKALRRRWLLAVICSLAGSALAGAGVWFGMPVKYTASATLHVSSREPKILGGEGQGLNDFAVYQKSQSAMVTSRLVLNSVLKDPAIARLGILPQDPDRQIDWLQQEIKVDFKTSPEIMKITMVGNQADELKTLLNTVAAVYLKEVVYKERNQKQSRLNYLKDLQSKYENMLRERRESVRKLVLALGSGDAQVLAVKQRYATETLGATERELNQVKGELRRLKINLKFAEGKEKGKAPALEVPASQVEQALDREPALIPMLTQRDQLKKDLDHAAELAVKGMAEPALSPRIERLKAAEATLKAARDRLRPAVKERLLAMIGSDRNVSAAELRERIAFSEELEKSLSESVDRLRQETRATNVGQADVEAFKVEIAQAEKLAERVAVEVSYLTVEVDAPKRVELLEEASASLGALERQRSKATIGAAAVVLLFIVGFISWREYRHRRLDSPHELANDLGMKVVGALPILPSASRSLLPWHAANSEDDAGHLTECIDATRTNLLHVAREKDTRVVLVTSALSGEGKTSLSCHLAASLARAGFRTLLIDGDMRQPAIHHALNIDADKGLSELLRQEIELDKAVHATAINHLWIIAGGEWSPAATAALARTRLPNLLKDLRERYEYIIIDSAPLLPVVDSLLLGQHADGVVLSVLREVSQLPLISSAAERLESVGIRILGVIANGVAADIRMYRYGYRSNSLQIDAAESTPA
jgi:succinoglycan biosynthesis transport protein ExoP